MYCNSDAFCFLLSASPTNPFSGPENEERRRDGPGGVGFPFRTLYLLYCIHTCMQTNKQSNKQMRNHIYCNRVTGEVSEVEVDEVGVSRVFSHERTKEKEPVVCLFVCLFFSWWVSE